ncbi:MAG: hypothetical protein CO161_02655, partial [Candidatus Portnoybacteria bacterium CG_4_9_14_3_um_filter_44_9]
IFSEKGKEIFPVLGLKFLQNFRAEAGLRHNIWESVVASSRPCAHTLTNIVPFWVFCKFCQKVLFTSYFGL